MSIFYNLRMFTGIITGLGQITQTSALGGSTQHGKRLHIAAPAGYLNDVQLGDSIALNGACMTVTTFDAAAGVFTVDVSAESLDKTCGLGEPGAVNLEKALRAGDRLGGHIVSGHVDGVGRVQSLEAVGESWELRIVMPADLRALVAYKGSVTVNGVSLTVNRVDDTPRAGATHSMESSISINLIPHTLTHTTLGGLKAGSSVNLEVDMLARYMQRLMAVQNAH